MAYVYILKSDSKQRYYIGCTGSLLRRLNEHRHGKVSSTKSLLPVKLVFQQHCLTFSEARTLESRLKRFKRKDFLEKIIKEGKVKSSLRP